ncbi:MAG: hypothetical protein QOH12_2205 [Solirubrobacteraceae bacterium]|jgi:hypothetical protein|nr:hypothetical protein [Solirubrobacteraceae bacterium]
MDNSLDIPGYKCFVDPQTASRPDVFVAFLSISPAPGGRVNGRLIEVSTDDLVELDRRERNYVRVDVTDRLAGAAGGTVWSYVGTPEAHERFAGGLRSGRVVIGDEYYESVRRAFADGAPDGLAEFERLTAPPPCPIVALRRVSL